jgi:hypothetical protein
MDVLSIKGTSQYPEVLLDMNTGIFKFSGNSLPEDAKGFFEPILDWIDNYIQSPRLETSISFQMTYYNTPSSKFLFQILKKFESIHLRKSAIKIIWKYPEEDSDMRDAGVDLSESIKIPFQLEPFKE